VYPSNTLSSAAVDVIADPLMANPEAFILPLPSYITALLLTIVPASAVSKRFNSAAVDVISVPAI
jgi:hypothetical protein